MTPIYRNLGNFQDVAILLSADSGYVTTPCFDKYGVVTFLNNPKLWVKQGNFTGVLRVCK